MMPSVFSQTSRREDFVAEGLYGSLEPFFRGLRQAAPRDWSFEKWRATHPGGSFGDWSVQARQFVLSTLNYDPGPLDLRPETLSVEARDGYTLEHVAFHTAAWSRVEGFFAQPDGPGPFPAVLALHSWGGPMLLGKERVFPGTRRPRLLREMIDRAYGGVFYGEELARRGYAVLAADAHHFGSRLPWGARLVPTAKEPWLPARPEDALQLDDAEFERLDAKAKELIDYSARYVGWAGATWTGINFWDDSRSVDYLLSRPEVDGSRIGCVGQSGGGYRAHFLAGLDTRVKASVSAGWFTTGDWTQVYKLLGPVGPAHLVPGLWQRMDFPDVALLAAPRAKLVVCGQNDPLFAPEAMEEAAARVREGYAWAGRTERFEFFHPDTGHCFDLEAQGRAWTLFEKWL